MSNSLLLSFLFSVEGLQQVEKIVGDARDRAGGVRRLVQKIKAASGEASVSISDISRLSHVASGKYGIKFIEKKLQALAPYTFNSQTGQPYAFEELMAIAVGSRRVAPTQPPVQPKEVPAQPNFFCSPDTTAPHTIKAKGKRSGQSSATRSAKSRVKAAQGGAVNMASAGRKKDFFEIVEDLVQLEGRESFLARTQIKPERLDAILLCRQKPSEIGELAAIAVAIPDGYPYTLADLIEILDEMPADNKESPSDLLSEGLTSLNGHE